MTSSYWPQTLYPAVGPLSLELQQLYRSSQLCDVTIRAEEGFDRVRAHRIILASLSPVLKSMIVLGFSESTQEEIVLREVCPWNLRSLVEYGYGIPVKLHSMDSALALCQMADLLQVTTVKQDCIRVIKEGMTDVEATKVLGFSAKFHLKELEDISIAIVQAKFEECCKTPDFLLLSPETIKKLLRSNETQCEEDDVFAALAAWLLHEPDRMMCWASTLLPWIRYPQLSVPMLQQLRTEGYVGIPFVQELAQDLVFICSDCCGLTHSDTGAPATTATSSSTTSSTTSTTTSSTTTSSAATAVTAPLEPYSASAAAIDLPYVYTDPAAACYYGQDNNNTYSQPYSCPAAYSAPPYEPLHCVVTNNNNNNNNNNTDVPSVCSSPSANEDYMSLWHVPRKLRCFNPINAKVVHELSGHTKSVGVLAIVKGKLVSGSYDCLIKVWNLTTFQEEHSLENHRSGVVALASCKNEEILASGSHDTSIALWDTKTWQHLFSLNSHSLAVFMLTSRNGMLFSGSGDTKIKVWCTESWNCLATLEGHTDWVYALEARPHHLLSGGCDGKLIVWDSKSWQRERTLTPHEEMDVLAIISAQTYVITSGADNNIKVWDPTTWSCLRVLQGHTRGVSMLVLCGDILVSAGFDNAIRSWSLSTWLCERTIDMENAVCMLATYKDTLCCGSSTGAIQILR